jgi:zinc protease
VRLEDHVKPVAAALMLLLNTSLLGQTWPAIKRDYLLNGLQVIMLERPEAEYVRLQLRINSGAMFDLAGKGGLADITARMLLLGGGGLSSENIKDTIEHFGLKVDVLTSWDSTDIVILGPADSLDGAIDLLSRIVITPAFGAEELEAVKQERAARLKEGARDDAELIRRKALEAIFGSHPFGRPAHGTAETVSQITRQDLTYYHSRFYMANNAVLVVSGRVAQERAMQLARSKLGIWKKGQRVPVTFRPPEPIPERRIFIFDRPGDQMASATLAEIGFSRRAEDYYAAIIMIRALANMIAPLEVRFEPRYLAGPLLIEFRSEAKNLPEAIQAALAAMGKLRAGAFAADQIERAKREITESFWQSLSTEEGYLKALLDIELYGLGRDYIWRFAERINAVTTADVARAAREYLSPEALAIVAAAPADQLEGQLKKFGPVTVIR